MGPNVIQHESNDGLAINKHNGISNATYIGKLLDAAHAMRTDILYATVMMVQFAKHLLQGRSRAAVVLVDEDARAEVRDLLAWMPVAVDAFTLEREWKMQDRYQLSFWEAR